MSLPDIDFKEIRLHGSQAGAFEELCCQLACDEASPGRLRFDRKGRGGDAGVECFETLDGGSETGWQVKYYWDIDSMLSSLGASLEKALVKHPKMSKFIACFPFDLADARKDGATSALEKWEAWRATRIAVAATTGRTITLERWDAHALRQRLTASNPRAAGRIAFWFDQRLLDRDWFHAKLERAKASLGERYDPQGHIDLPIGQAIRAVTGDPALFEKLAKLGEAIRRAAADAVPIKGEPVEDACDAATSALQTAAETKAVAASELHRLVLTAADAALQLHDRLGEGSDHRRPTDAMVAVSTLAVQLRSVLSELEQPHWALLNRQALLVYGDAGSGKSHLLAESCAYQLASGRPALLILGGTLIDAEPWAQILQHLDLPRRLEAGQFLGALNAAGEAAGVRALIAIDALNEKNGQLVWPDRLPGLLHDIERFPWIAVVLSCRTTYLDAVIPDTLNETKLPRIEHQGFSIAEVRDYLRQRGMTLPETPLQASEFQIPLFLRLYCSALDQEGQTLLARGLSGVSEIFRAYTAAVTRRVHRQLRMPPGRTPGDHALAALAREMADTGRGEIALERAEAIARDFHPGRSNDDDLLFQLQNEGMLALEPMRNASGDLMQVVRFTFERMADHAIVAGLLARSASACISGLCAAKTPLHEALSADDSRIVFGLLEALAIQLPEHFGVELPDLPGLPTDLGVDDAFVQSLQVRRLDAITPRTWELVDKIDDPALRYDTMVALATEPGHTYNVRHLDEELRLLTMAKRDSCWSTYLAGSPDAAFHLIDWVLSADSSAIAVERADLAAVQLSWFLTTTRRPVRDKATKALVVLLADRAALAIEIWRRFKNLDDLYIVERIMASLFGAAMQGRWRKEELRAIAEMLHADLFANGTPPTNLLLRDHASGLVGYAASRGVLPPGFDLVSTRPPFRSPWPIEYVSENQIAAFVASYGAGGKRHRDDIVSSLRDGDFARYVLDQVAGRFSPASRGTDPLPSAQELREQWFTDFKASANKVDLAAYAALQSEIAAIQGASEGAASVDCRNALHAAKQAFCAAVGSARFEDWRARAENWRAEGMYQFFASQGPAGFNLAWARRWVMWRAHDLGWSEALHHEFDRRIRTGRNSHEVERIGKKYQWLATYELAARMADNLALLPGQEEPGPSRLRNIDPSLLRDHTGSEGLRNPRGASFWAPSRPIIQAASASEALAWLKSGVAVVDGPENVEVTGPDGRKWLVLAGFEMWADACDHARLESWRRIACTVVHASDRKKFLNRLKGTHMTGQHDMPVSGGYDWHRYLGEHPWAWPDHTDENGWISDWLPNGANGKAKGLSVRPPTTEYIAESGGYDYSVSQDIRLYLPSKWLINALGLHLSDGRSVDFRNAAGEVLFMDPSAASPGGSAALVERRAFLAMLKREQLVAIWAVAGENSVFGKLHTDGYGGCRSFTRLFVTSNEELQPYPRFETFDQPSLQQRAALLGRVPESMSGDDDEGLGAEAEA